MLKAKPTRNSPSSAELTRSLAKAEIELEQMRAALNQLSDGVVISDGEGNLLDWNPAALRLHGYQTVEEVRQNIADFKSNFRFSTLNGTIVPFEQWPLARLIRGETLDDCEHCVERLDVQKSWIIRFTGAAIRDSTGKATLLIVYLHDLTEARQASSAQRDMELRLRGFVETAADGIITVDEAGLIESVNPAIHTVFDYEPAEIIGRHVNLLMPRLVEQIGSGEEREHDMVTHLRSINDTQELEGRTRSGRLVPLELSVGEMRLDGRRIFTGVLRDISKRKEAERRLKDHQSMLRTLTEAINDPVYIKSADGKFLFVNAALANLAERRVESCIGLTASEVFGPEIAAVSHEADRRVMEMPTAQTYEESVQFGDERRHYLITKCRFTRSDGSVGGIFGISRDITRLKQAEQAQRNSARHLRDVMDSLPVIVMVLDSHYRVMEMNRTAAEDLRSIQVDPAQAINRPLDHLGWSGESEETRLLIQSAIAAAGRGRAVAHSAVVIDRLAATLYFDVTFAPLHDADGTIRQIIVSATDVSQRQAAEKQSREHEAQLAHLERMQTMGHMAAGLAHELNQPLGAIANYAAAAQRTLAQNRAPAQSADRSFERIINEALRAGDIIRRLRAFVKKQKPQMISCDVNQLVHDSLSILAFEFRSAGLQVRLKLSTAPLPVIVDPIQLTQVLVNLLKNAADALAGLPSAERSIEIHTLARADQAAILRVVDLGTGVCEADFNKLFDSFFTTKSSGMGLGLSLCRMIVENHGGQIEAIRNPERGMTFKVTLPPQNHVDGGRGGR